MRLYLLQTGVRRAFGFPGQILSITLKVLCPSPRAGGGLCLVLLAAQADAFFSMSDAAAHLKAELGANGFMQVGIPLCSLPQMSALPCSCAPMKCKASLLWARS